MIEKYLEPVKNKCRCGKTASGIKEVTNGSNGKEAGQRIVASTCTMCGLKFVADDMRGYLTPSMQEIIKKYEPQPAGAVQSNTGIKS